MDFDCRTCGACCVSPEDTDAWVDLLGSDVARLGKPYSRRNVVWSIDGYHGFSAIRTRWKRQRSGPLRGASVCACVSLRGSVLHRTSCAVYERRPRACREMRPGSRECREARVGLRQAIEEYANA